MCFILVAWQARDDYPLVIAANRDEYLRRPSRSAHWWQQDILAGIDLQQGGTWLGLNRSGRFAAVTNYRSGNSASAPLSRGKLVTDYLASTGKAGEFLDVLENRSTEYAPFNLLLGSASELHYSNNFSAGSAQLSPGIHGLSNAELNTPWPKLRQGKQSFKEILESPRLDTDALFDLLQSPEPFPDHELPATGLPLERERALSAIFIHGPEYGTRSSTVIAYGRDGDIRLEERNHAGDYQGTQSSVHHFQIASDRLPGSHG